MRFDGPTQMMARTTTEDVALHGRTIPAGSKVALLFISANRDERKFERAEMFDIRRNARDHLGFGAGAHACLGAPLARLEARVALEEILAARRISPSRRPASSACTRRRCAATRTCRSASRRTTENCGPDQRDPALNMSGRAAAGRGGRPYVAAP